VNHLKLAAPISFLLVFGILPQAWGAVAHADDVAFGPNDVRSVFFIAKNENKNEVHYGVHLDAQCKPVGKAPLFAYWQEREKGPNVILPLAGHEGPAYGIESQKVVEQSATATQLLMRLRALDKRDLLIQIGKGKDGCTAQAFTKIRGIASVFERGFIVVAMWRIRELTLFGKRIDNQKPISEKIEP
jgi:hypothetical protein